MAIAYPALKWLVQWASRRVQFDEAEVGRLRALFEAETNGKFRELMARLDRCEASHRECEERHRQLENEFRQVLVQAFRTREPNEGG